MATLYNEITINAPIEKIWNALSEIEMLDKYDPTVKRSTAVTASKSGLGAKRKVEMLDGKNWFEEQVITCRPNEALTYELTACSFPVRKLLHEYSFEIKGNQVKVKQITRYDVKFGLLGKLLDVMMISKQSDAGIKKFMAGLKSFTEKN